MRKMFDREFYRPKKREGCKDLRVRTFEDLPGSEVWTYEANGSPYAAVFGGKRAKPDWHYRFKTAESREEKIAGWLAGMRRHAETVAERRKERYEPHGFEPGQLFYASWGYDQTNIDYYRLEKLRGKTMGYIVPVTSRVLEDPEGETHFTQNRVGPGEEIRDWDVLLGVGKSDEEKGKWKRLTKDGFTVSHAHAGPCSAESSRYETAAGFGH